MKGDCEVKKMEEPLCVAMHDTKHTITSHMTPTNQEYKNGNLKIPHNIFISTLIRASFKACS